MVSVKKVAQRRRERAEGGQKWGRKKRRKVEEEKKGKSSPDRQSVMETECNKAAPLFCWPATPIRRPHEKASPKVSLLRSRS